MPESRIPTAVDALAERHLAAAVELSPVLATYLGLDFGQDRHDDFSPDGRAASAALARHTVAEAACLTPQDEVDRVTLTVLNERLGLQLETHEARADLLSVNGIASDLHSIREVYDLMPQSGDDDWAMIARRLQAVPAAIDGWFGSQQAAVGAGLPPARRQAELLAEQCRSWAGAGGYFDVLGDAAGARPASLTADLTAGLAVAKAAFWAVAERIEAELLPQASEVDAVGRERYQRASRYFLGATVDLDETYEWGLDELARIVAEQEAVAAELYGPGTTPEEAMARLDADPARQLHGTDALQRWMQETSDAAVDALAGVHFDIPDQLRGLECCIAPTQDGGIYYTGPTADFSRPGRMWWSVPPGVTEFSTWRELTTVYHEGVPGHHLQMGQAVYRAADLNRWRSLLCWVSGHGEGWALYAERLMADLGFLDDPGDRLGMLDSQRLRAARVVLDIGVHLGKRCPDAWGGGTWNAEKAWPFLKANVNMAEGFVRFELDRYLGWPGQAPSYKVGQRLWEQARDEAARRDGFDIKDFHRRALDLGSVGLDVLRDALLAP